MTRTIIFDLGRVLIPFDFERGYSRMSKKCGLPNDEIRARLAATGAMDEYEGGRQTSQEFFETVCDALGMKLSYEEFCSIWVSIFLPETLVPEEFVAALHRRYRLVLLSNTNEIHFTWLRKTYPILNHFDAYVLSHEVKALKPEDAIYDAVLKQADAAAPECFYTDDVAPFVEGAKRHGIDAVQFQGFDKLRDEMSARGISWTL